MPNKPKRPCKYPGCAVLVESGYCEKHKKNTQVQYDKHRGTAHQRGYDTRWRRYRESYLRSHPLCVKCYKDNRITIATVIDHIIPHKGDMVLFWDSNNHQPLCKQCHDKKTAKEDGGFGNGKEERTVVRV